MNETESAKEIETKPEMNDVQFTFLSNREPGSK